MRNIDYAIYTDKNVNRNDLSQLLTAVNFGANYDEASLSKSILAATLIVYAIDSTDNLIGYLSAFSDGVFSAFIDMVIVCPSVQRLGIGHSLVEVAEKHFANIPIYVTTFEDQRGFFEKQGYKTPKRPMRVLFKKNNLTKF